MKKWVCLFSICVLLLSATACNNAPATSESNGDITVTTTTTTAAVTTITKVDGTAMTDDEAHNLCVAKMQQAYQIESWYMNMDYPFGTEMLPAGTAVTFLDGTAFTLDHEYYRLADSLPETDRAVTTTALAFKQHIETVYTVDAIADRYYHSSTWVVYQDEMYRVAAEGTFMRLDVDTICVINKDTTAITFTIAGWDDEPPVERTLRYIDGNWKFDELV